MTSEPTKSDADRRAHSNWLDELNALVSAGAIASEAEQSPRISMVVTGAPRTGTTYLLQTIQRRLPASVVDHLVASFWKRPAIGVLLSEHLRARTQSESLMISDTSAFGLTPNWYEPHEFSYFWRDALGWRSPHEEPTDAEKAQTDYHQLGSLLAEAAAATRNPLALKGFSALWCGTELLDANPRMLLIVQRREMSALARSLERGWLELPPDRDWFSLRPAGWEAVAGQPLKERVKFQVSSLAAAADRLLESGHERILAIDHAELVADPNQVAARVRSALAHFGRVGEVTI